MKRSTEVLYNIVIFLIEVLGYVLATGELGDLLWPNEDTPIWAYVMGAAIVAGLQRVVGRPFLQPIRPDENWRGLVARFLHVMTFTGVTIIICEILKQIIR